MSETPRTPGLARIEAVTGQGMITLRGDLDSRRVKSVLKAAGLRMPAPLTCTFEGGRGIGWMAPDEGLILLAPDAVAGALATIAAKTGAHHITAVDTSDARAVFRLTGAGAREVLAKLSPVDFAPDRFGPGSFRRTRLAQVPVAVWQERDMVFGVICFRSVAGYVTDLLTTASEPGSEVGYFVAGG